jgi:hypothetical protein
MPVPLLDQRHRAEKSLYVLRLHKYRLHAATAFRLALRGVRFAKSLPVKQPPFWPRLIRAPAEQRSSALPLPPRSHSEQSTYSFPFVSYVLYRAFLSAISFSL